VKSWRTTSFQKAYTTKRAIADHRLPFLVSMSPRLHLDDPTATTAAGARLATAVRAGLVVTLSGDLGAGKTTLVRGCLRALGWPGPVKSPTYTLVEHYPLPSLYFYHFDFYRFEDPSEWDTAGLADCFRADSVCVVEWPERVGRALPPPDLALTLAYPAASRHDGRELTLRARTEAGERCVNAILAVAEPTSRSR
jgi:tRNA threonylcarbamoyladenosine biosynthesis protein TsaE